MEPRWRVRRVVAACVGACSIAVTCAGCGSNPPTPCLSTPLIVADAHLIVDEKQNTFTPGARSYGDGTLKITLDVPAGALGRHGIAIDGGVYKNIEGAAVKAGRATSLTVALKPGRYVVYDPVGNNRAKGMRARLTITKRPAAEMPCGGVT